jgi:hypothetical protein
MPTPTDQPASIYPHSRTFATVQPRQHGLYAIDYNHPRPPGTFTERRNTRDIIQVIPPRAKYSRPRQQYPDSSDSGESDAGQHLTDEHESSEDETSDDEPFDHGRWKYIRPRPYNDRYDSREESEDECDVNRAAYHFNIIRHSRNSQSESTLVGEQQQTKDDASSLSQVPIGSFKRGETHYVYRSQYTGTASSGGTQSAQLTVMPDQKKSRPPLFRWM